MEGKPHKIELLVSNMSGMKRILKDGYLIFEKQMRFGNFHHSMPIDNHMISIIEMEDRFDFRIDNQPFSLLYLSERNKSSFKREGYSSSTEEYGGYRAEPYRAEPSRSEPKPPSYTSSQPKKKDALEFDTGFGMYEYKGAQESQSKSYARKSKPEKPPANMQWNDTPDPSTEYKAPPEPNREYNWDGPSNFQFDESNAQAPPPPPTTAAAPVYNQRASVPQPRSQMPPPVQTRPPVKEQPKPIIDFLDTEQPNALPDDLFSNGLGLVPTTGQQYKQAGILDFPQPTAAPTMPQPAMNTAAPAGPSNQYTQPSTYPTAPSNPYGSPPMNPAPNPSPSYAPQPENRASLPAMRPEEKKAPSADMTGFFDNPPRIFL